MTTPRPVFVDSSRISATRSALTCDSTSFFQDINVFWAKILENGTEVLTKKNVFRYMRDFSA